MGNAIIETKIDGSYWREYGVPGSGIGAFRAPWGLYYDTYTEYYYIGDSSNNRIIKTKFGGEGWQTLGTLGSGTGNFSTPSGVSHDPSTEFIYVADRLNNRIVKTKIDGDGWQSYGSYGTGVGNIKDPQGIFYDAVSDYIYLPDNSNDRVVKTKIDGTGWTTYGARGAVRGQAGVGFFNYPCGLYYDAATEYLYIADQNNFRLVRTKMDGSGWVIISSPTETILETQGDDMKLEFSPQENVLRFYPRRADQGHMLASSYLGWDANEWHKVRLQYDQSLGTASLYIDDVLNVAHTFDQTWTPPFFGQYFYLGSDKDGTYSSSWKGLIDEVKISKETDLYSSTGSFVTNKIIPTSPSGTGTEGILSWKEISISQTLNSGTATYDVLDGDTVDSGSAITSFGGLTPNGSGKISLSSLSYSTYPDIKIRANLVPNGERTASPTVDSLSVSWNIDSTGPEKVQLVSPSQNEYAKENLPTFKWRETTDSQSSVSHYHLYIDGNQIAKDITGSDVNSVISYTLMENDLPPDSQKVLTENSHNWYVLAEDSVGNLSSTTDNEERTLRVDRRSPIGSILINSGDQSTKFKSLNLHIEGTDPMPSPNTYNLPSDYPSGISEYRISTNKDFAGSNWSVLVSTTNSKSVSKDTTIDVSSYPNIISNLKSGDTITIYLQLKDQAGNETEAGSISDTILYQPTALSNVADTVITTVSDVVNTFKETVENVIKPKKEENEEKSIPNSTPTTQPPLSCWQRFLNFLKRLF